MNLHPAPGQAVYSRRVLAVYDLVVLGISNRFIWRCPTKRLLAMYDQHVSANHLDVGVGTGYFLDRCTFPLKGTEPPRISLFDLNRNSLSYTANRIARYGPTTHHGNVLEPIALDENGSEHEKYDSVAMNYLLHCLPGTMATKSVAFDHLRSHMNPAAVLFGATVLPPASAGNLLASQLMGVYNRRGIFSNQQDDLDSLREQLSMRFTDVSITVVGCVALFAARNLLDS